MTLDKIQKFYLENGNTKINPKCIYYNESINKLFISSINDGDGGEFFDLNNNTIESYYWGGISDIFRENPGFKQITFEQLKGLLE